MRACEGVRAFGKYKREMLCFHSALADSDYINLSIHLLTRIFFTATDLSPSWIRDLRGNSFQCSCENKWLMTWLKNTNATVSDVPCAGPNDMKGKRLNDVPIPPGECTSTGNVKSKSTIKKKKLKLNQI